MIQLVVRELDALVAAARATGAPIVTIGGMPVNAPTVEGNRRAVLLRDPDCYVVMAIQGAATDKSATTSTSLGFRDGVLPPRGRGNARRQHPDRTD